MTNNEAEYEAILTGLDLAKVAGVSSVALHSNSQVVVRHINRDYEAKGEQMKKYLYLIRRRANQTFAVKFLQVLREENEHVNWLAKSISTGHITVDWQDLCFVQQSFAIEELEMQMIPKGTDWTTPIISYLKNGTLPEDHDESRRLKV